MIDVAIFLGFTVVTAVIVARGHRRNPNHDHTLDDDLS